MGKLSIDVHPHQLVGLGDQPPHVHVILRQLRRQLLHISLWIVRNGQLVHGYPALFAPIASDEVPLVVVIADDFYPFSSTK